MVYLLSHFSFFDTFEVRLTQHKVKWHGIAYWEMPQSCSKCTEVVISTSSCIICLRSYIQNWQFESAV